MRRLKTINTIIIAFAVALFLLPLWNQSMAAEFERITIDELKDLLSDGNDVVVVDTRSEASYESGHILGAVSMPYPDGIQNRADELPKDKTIILYCA